MSALLAIETSGAVGTVALRAGGRLVERSIATPREQTELILPIIAGLLSEAGTELRSLDAIVFGRGPGSFTGLRIAAAIAQGLAMSVHLPVIAVSSLAATAQRAWDDERIAASLVCVDARMGEVYWARFEIREGLAQLLGAERIGAPEAVIIDGDGRFAALGGGFAAHPQALAPVAARAERVLPELAPRARDLLPQAESDFAAGRVLAATAALPVYLRDATAWQR
jgi:tRNA threonylcarbamoyladenosine biosynthesis protein TsaB